MIDISIIMPVYNNSIYLNESIESVLNQTFENFELIIIDDGSIDNTIHILEYYKKLDERVKIFRNQKNIGIAKSLNKGISLSNGKYIARIDSDDTWESDKLKKQINYLKKKPDIVLLGSNAIYINEKGEIIKNKNNPIYFSDNKIRKNILKYNLFCHSSVIFQKDHVKKLGYYNEKYPNTEDYELWLRIIKSYKAEILPDKLVRYRIHKKMKSALTKKEQIKYFIKIKIKGFKLLGFRIPYLYYLIKDLFTLIMA